MSRNMNSGWQLIFYIDHTPEVISQASAVTSEAMSSQKGAENGQPLRLVDGIWTIAGSLEKNKHALSKFRG